MPPCSPGPIPISAPTVASRTDIPGARAVFLGYWPTTVRDAGLLSLEAAVHKMSGLAAHHMGFEGRGLVVAGHRADLVLLDPERVVDRATTSDPFLMARGIDRVWVNGVQVWRAGAATGNYPGRVIRRAVSGN